ncbi:MAG: hypothetical protein U0841_10255 [Chloroflexia bacterium]
MRKTARLWEDIGFRALPASNFRSTLREIISAIRNSGVSGRAPLPFGLSIPDSNSGTQRFVAHALVFIEQA